MTKCTYAKRLGVVVPGGYGPPGIIVAGVEWATISSLIAVMPDIVDDYEPVKSRHEIRPLPPGVVVGMTNYDGMVVLR